MIFKFVVFGLVALIEIRFSSTYHANCPLDYNSCYICGPSPININMSEVIKVDLPPLAFQIAPKEYGTLTNTGVTLESLIRQPTKSTISGGPFSCTNDNYTLYKDRFYFTSSSTQFAIGAVNGLGTNVGVDAVYFNDKYGSYENALGYTDGICVFFFMINAGGTKNASNFENFAAAVRQVIEPQSSVTIPKGTYNDWVVTTPFAEDTTYLFYQGQFSERPDGGANTCSYCATVITPAPNNPYYNISISQAQYDESFGLVRNALNRPLEYAIPIYDGYDRPVYEADGLNLNAVD